MNRSRTMPPDYSPLECERAEMYAQRTVLIELIGALKQTLPNFIADLRTRAAKGGQVKPYPGYLSVKDQLLRDRILALLAEVR